MQAITKRRRAPAISPSVVVVLSRTTRVWAGIHFRSGADAGLMLGRPAAKRVIDMSETDGSQPR